MINRCHTLQCSVEEIQNIKKINIRESEEKKFEKKVRKIYCFSIYIVALAFLPSTVKKADGRS